jgi:hypothetical protein
MLSLFNDIMLPHVSGVALERALAAFSLLSEPDLNDYWSSSNNLAAQYVKLEGRRNLWWRSRYKDGSSYWICLDPAEYRHTPPEASATVRDLPAQPLNIWCRDILQSALEFAAIQPNGLGDKERLVEIVEARLRQHRNTPPRLPPEVASQVRQALRDSTPANFRNVVFGLYENYLLSYRLDAEFLNQVILLLQLQSAFGTVINEDWLSEPKRYLACFVRRVLQEPTLRTRAVSAAADICNKEFKSGREYLRAALQSDQMADATSSLFHAYHLFSIVRIITTLFDKNGVSLPGLSFIPNVVQEAVVCTMTGITVGALFLIEHPISYPTKISLEFKGVGLDYASAQRQSRSISSEIQPFVTRRFADILAAHALVISSNLDVVKAGVAEMLRLGEGIPGSFERGWIDLALVDAYNRLGRENLARAAAFRVAAQLVV